MTETNEQQAPIFSGAAITLNKLQSGIFHLCFDAQGAPVNKFDQATLTELGQVLDLLAESKVRGLICSSAKSSFIVGADIAEFTGLFARPEAELLAWVQQTNELFTELETLEFPTVSVIQGHALGGGFEFCLATDYRIASADVVLGFPEVGLGICPGFGGTVRAPRVMEREAAIQWILSGQQYDVNQALAVGAIDSITDAELLLDAAIEQIEMALAEPQSLAELRAQKAAPVCIEPVECAELLEPIVAELLEAKDFHNPAPARVLTTLDNSLLEDRDDALQNEALLFVALARSDVAKSLIGLFTNDQWLRAKSRRLGKQAGTIGSAGIIGAGIMGGGIAYQCALKKVPVVMKDIAQAGLDAGLNEAQQLFTKLVTKGRLDQGRAAKQLALITPTLNNEDIAPVDIVVEAVVENPKVKKAVLAQVESLLSDKAILTSNTSTISITDLASALQHPERFCGMHFFNPVPLMPLVEVIRGEKTSDTAIATTVAFAQTLGKMPIVVNDCPGFLVNRILFPYFGAFSALIRDGADYRQIDAVMEAFGWPMGPAYLLDVVGMDTAVHAQAVMAQGFPERMDYGFKSAMDLFFDAGELGQKTGSGFYRYERGANGRMQKLVDESIVQRVQDTQEQQSEFSDEDIIARLMVALCLETVRCLEDGIVESPIEADMGLILGLGFPKFRGGALRYIDTMGVDVFCALADSYAALGPLYEVTPGLRAMAQNESKFYS
ncbi:MAG: fatty acid oxidation complex subunit alpha FadB [Gammaproteobacteria bacterium]